MEVKLQLVFPMAFYVFYTWGLAVFNFRTRLRSIRAGEFSPKFFKAFTGSPPPENVVVVGRHYDNQFQLPMLFYTGVLTHMILNQASYATLVLAWGFIVSRLIHSFVHLGSNKIQLRAVAFAAGWFFIVLLWGHLAYSVLSAMTSQ